MKHFGAKMEFGDERIRDLMKEYDKYIAECSHIKMRAACKEIVNRPAPRFYVSEERASVVVSELISGKLCRNKLKNEMFCEIHRRVMELQKVHPTMSLLQLCEIVIQQPAPKFYITPSSARVYIIRFRKKWIKEKLKRLHLYGCL